MQSDTESCLCKFAPDRENELLLGRRKSLRLPLADEKDIPRRLFTTSTELLLAGGKEEEDGELGKGTPAPTSPAPFLAVELSAMPKDVRNAHKNRPGGVGLIFRGGSGERFSRVGLRVCSVWRGAGPLL